jgi:hypothetical protein
VACDAGEWRMSTFFGDKSICDRTLCMQFCFAPSPLRNVNLEYEV